MNAPSLKEQIAYYIFHQDGYFLAKHRPCEPGNELQYTSPDEMGFISEDLRFHTEEEAIEYAEYIALNYSTHAFQSFDVSEHCIVRVKTTISFNICKTLT